MFQRTDTLTKYFMCLMAHFSMTTIVIFDQTAHLEASVIGAARVTEESRIGFTVCLVLQKIGILIEIASLVVDLPSIPRSLYSTLSHSISTCLFLLFIYDSHPISHFWFVSAAFSLIPMLLAVRVLVEKVAKRKIE